MSESNEMTCGHDGLMRPGPAVDVGDCPSNECQIRRQCTRRCGRKPGGFLAAIFGAAPELPEDGKALPHAEPAPAYEDDWERDGRIAGTVEELADLREAVDVLKRAQAGHLNEIDRLYGMLAKRATPEDSLLFRTLAAEVDEEDAPAMPSSDIATGQEAHAAVMQRLTDLGRLPDDWGGSEKPSARALKMARHLVEEMQSRGHLVLRLAPMAYGGVGLTYLEGERRARFDVYNDEPGSVVVVVMRGSADAHDRYVESWESDAIEIMSLFLRANSLETETETETANLRAQLKDETDEHIACAEDLRQANAKLDAIATRSYGTESLFSLLGARTTLENTEHLDPGESADVARVDLWVELREACDEIERLETEATRALRRHETEVANLRGAVEMLNLNATEREGEIERLTKALDGHRADLEDARGRLVEIEISLGIERTALRPGEQDEPHADRLMRIHLRLSDLQRAARAKAETLARWKRRAGKAEQRIAVLEQERDGLTLRLGKKVRDGVRRKVKR